MSDVWIAGAGMTRFGRRDESLPDLIAEAGLAALADAGIERPDALVVAAMNPEEFTGAGNYALADQHPPRSLRRAGPARGDGDLVGGGRGLRRLRRDRGGHPSDACWWWAARR